MAEPVAPVAAARPLPPPIVTTDPKTRLFREGLPIAMKMLRKPEPAVRALLGKWLKATGDDAELVHETIGDAALEDVAEATAWITKTLAARVKARGGSSPGPAGAAVPAGPAPDLGATWVADRARPRPWFATLAKRAKGRGGEERWAYGGSFADAAENRILEAARLPTSWPGDMEPAVRWLVDGWELGVICRVIGEIAGRDGYNPPRSMRMFDAAVRAAAPKEGRF